MPGTTLRRPLHPASPAAAVAMALLLCSCGPGSPPAPRPALRLEPVPEPPAIALPPSDVPLEVVAARPLGSTGGDAQIAITFSKPVVALGQADDPGVPPPARIEPALPGEWRWLGSSSVEFVPEHPIPWSTRHVVMVEPGLRALDGSRLAAAFRYAFDTPRPHVQDADPPHGHRWLPARPRFTLLLNQPVLGLERAAALEVVPERGKPRRVALRLVGATSVQDERRAARGARRRGPEPAGPAGPHLLINRQTRYELVPAEQLPLHAAVRLRVEGSLRGVEGPLTLGKPHAVSYRTFGPLVVERAGACLFGEDAGTPRPACPQGPLVLFTSNRVDAASLRGRLTLDPPATIDWEGVESHQEGWGRPYVVLPGAFRAGTSYRVRLAAGTRDVFGQTAPTFEGQVALDDFEPRFDPGGEIALLELAGDGSLPIETVNVAAVPTETWRVDPAEMSRLLTPWENGHAEFPSRRGRARTLELPGARNVVRWVPFRLRDPDASRGGGLYAVRFQVPGPHRHARRVLAQVTDLAVHAKLGATTGLAWVTRLSSGASVAGAQVRLYDARGAERWAGRTDAQGLVRLPGLGTLLPGEPGGMVPRVLVAATVGDDTGVTLSHWHDGIAPWAFDVPGDWDGPVPRALGFLMAERGIYRPGERVHLKGLVRYRRHGSILTPRPGTTLDLRVTDSRGAELRRQGVALSAFGTFTTTLEIPDDAPLGTCWARAALTMDGQELSWGGDFRVEEYRPPQFLVDVSSPDAERVAGEDISVSVLARYLFGGAMSGAPVRWSATRQWEGFRPPGNEGFTFGAWTWGWDDDLPQPASEMFSAGATEADARGSARLDVGRGEAPGRRTWSYVVEAEVEDIDRQRVAGRTVVRVHPADVYAGLRVEGDGFAVAGREQTIELIAVTPDGARAEGVPISLEVRRRTWKSIRRRSAGGRWATVSEPVEQRRTACTVESGRSASECSFTPADPGLYLVEATVRDARGRTQTSRTSLYVTGPGWVSWQRGDTDRIDLVPDRALYDVGDVARILVKSPYPRAEAVLTVEREGVMRARRVRLEGSATTLEVPIDETMVPNVFVGVVIARGRVGAPGGIETGADPGRPEVRVGYTELSIEKKSRRLQVDLLPDRTVKRPRAEVLVDVRVRDAAGRGTPSEVTLWAVDEGVLRLTAYEPPDPVESIHPRRGLSVWIGEPLLHLVMRRLYGEKGATAGGGGGWDAAGSELRSRFRTTAVYTQTVTLADGRARVRFRLPDNLTTYRIMALAVASGDRFGLGRAEVEVSKPLLAMPALPRFLRVGDVVGAGVVVHSRYGGARSVTVEAAARGVVLVGDRSRSVKVAEGGPREVRFRIRAERPGTARLRFAVSSWGERDAVEQTIPVHLPSTVETVATHGEITAVRGRQVEALTTPGGARTDTGGLELTLASSSLAGFSESFRQLAEYPYGCVEQIASRLIPFVALREIARTFEIATDMPAAPHGWEQVARQLAGARDPDDLVRRTIRALESLQAHDGGFRYWPGDTCSTPWASAYAVIALARARDAGFAVDRAVLERAQRYLAEGVAAGRASACDGRAQAQAGVDDVDRVLALDALARSGAPRTSYAAELFSRRARLPLAERAMLAHAIVAGGGPRQLATRLLDEVLAAARESPAGVHLEELDRLSGIPVWESDARSTSIALAALLRARPEHPSIPKMVRWLLRSRGPDGRFRTTQEAGFALMALADVVRTRERDVPDFRTRVRLGPTDVVDALFRGRSLEPRRHAVPMARLGTAGTRLPLVIEKEGPGLLTYSAVLRHARAVAPAEPLDRGIIVQRWFEPYEGGGQLRRAVAGDLLALRVRVASSQERRYVAVEVPLPAGVEAVDASLATTARAETEPYDYETAEAGAEEIAREVDRDEGEVWETGFWSPFTHVELRDDRVLLFADRLPPGVHLSTFHVRATTPGRTLLQPAQAAEMYAPEVFGRTAAGRFEIVDAAPPERR